MLDTQAVAQYFVEVGMVPPDGDCSRYITVALENPELRRAETWADELEVNRQTLYRKLLVETGRSPVQWVKLFKTLRLWAELTEGKILREAAAAAGEPDAFTASNLTARTVGLRPTAIREMTWKLLVDLWRVRTAAPVPAEAAG